MTVDVATYLEQLEKNKGKLGRWEAEIFQLFRAKASYQHIANYLQLNNVKVTKEEVYRFIHRKKRRHLLNVNAPLESPPENIKNVQEIGGEEPKAATPPKPQENQPLEGSVMPKFNWRQNREKDKPKW
jgi:IS30 family transposase